MFFCRVACLSGFIFPLIFVSDVFFILLHFRFYHLDRVLLSCHLALFSWALFGFALSRNFSYSPLT